MKKPSGLKPAGRRLWSWLEDNCGTLEPAAPLVAQLCRLADRIDEVQAKLAGEGVTVTIKPVKGTPKVKPHPLATLEIKLLAEYRATWRLLGLAEEVPPQKRARGRPTDLERLERKVS